eukprot:Selendium_serpulae@DN6243_c0_g1_i8.p1
MMLGTSKRQSDLYSRIVGHPYFIAGLCITGIYTFYLLYSITQEHIFAIKDANTGEKVQAPVLLVFVTCVFNLLAAGSVLLWNNNFDVKCFYLARDPLKRVILTTLTYTGSLLASFYALGHVNVPSQLSLTCIAPLI